MSIRKPKQKGLFVLSSWCKMGQTHLRHGRPSIPSGENASYSPFSCRVSTSVWLCSTSADTHEKLRPLEGSRSHMLGSPTRSASLWSASCVRCRRTAGDTVLMYGSGIENLVRGCRDKNSAKTRFTIDAHVGTIVTYSGDPIKR